MVFCYVSLSKDTEPLIMLLLLTTTILTTSFELANRWSDFMRCYGFRTWSASIKGFLNCTSRGLSESAQVYSLPFLFLSVVTKHSYSTQTMVNT
jgi:hypothetical protein